MGEAPAQDGVGQSTGAAEAAPSSAFGVDLNEAADVDEGLESLGIGLDEGVALDMGDDWQVARLAHAHRGGMSDLFRNVARELDEKVVAAVDRNDVTPLEGSQEVIVAVVLGAEVDVDLPEEGVFRQF